MREQRTGKRSLRLRFFSKSQSRSQSRSQSKSQNFTGNALLLLIALLISLQLCFAPAPLFAAELPAGYLENTLQLIKQVYLEETAAEELAAASINGLFSALDPYSYFMPQAEAEPFIAGIEGHFGGIGTILIPYGDFTVVYELLEDSPAELAGLLPGDYITAVDGVSCVGLSLEETGDLIKGEPGTLVELEVWRRPGKNVFDIELTRGKIKINPLEIRLFGQTGYIYISTFNSNTREYFDQAMLEFERQGINKLILDVRGNPGGDAEAAAAVAEHFIPEGLIARLDFKDENNEDISFWSEGPRKDFELILLINRDSASASEILAGAVKDTSAGILVGERTFGKSRVQNLFPLLTAQAYAKYKLLYGLNTVNAYDVLEYSPEDLPPEEITGWAKITTGEYFTPQGKRIDGEGIEPDLWIDDYILVNGVDVHAIDRLSCTKYLTYGSEDIEILNAELLLALLGYDITGPDLSLDKKTSFALLEYQRNKGLAPNGDLDRATQLSLNLELERQLLLIDQPLAEALELLR